MIRIRLSRNVKNNRMQLAAKHADGGKPLFVVRVPGTVDDDRPTPVHIFDKVKAYPVLGQVDFELILILYGNILAEMEPHINLFVYTI